jgi:hypothetical protein
MPTVKMLALGDSVMWGQGLADPHKFVRLVQAYLGRGGGAVDLASLAHSGAIIDLAPQVPAAQTAFLFGELPRTYPSILSELAVAANVPGYGAYLQTNSWDRPSWAQTKQDLTRQIAGYSGAAGAPPDYILLDGGANDFKALQIVLPWNLHGGAAGGQRLGAAAVGESNVERVLATLPIQGPRAGLAAAALPELEWMTDEEFKALIDELVFQRMRGLLAQVGPAFPRSRVVITGYYPIFTPGSLAALTASPLQPAVATLLARSDRQDEQLAALAWGLNFNVDPVRYANRILQQSQIWYEYGTERLREAAAEANGRFGNRFAVASPAFGPDNGALAPQSYIWTLAPVADAILREILRLFGGGGAAAPAQELAPEAMAAGIGSALAFGSGYALGAGLATDEVTGERSLAAYDYYVWSSTGRNDPGSTFFGGFTSSVASAGHPNPGGAEAFAAAIEPLV